MKSGILKNLFLGLTVMLATSCSLDDDANYYYNDTAAHGIIANTSPSSGDLYFFADANQIGNTPLNYNEARGYYDFFTGDRTLSIKDETGQVLATAEITLAVGNFFSAFAVNTFDNIELVTYEDALVKPVNGVAHVRFINLSPDAAAIDIDGNTSQSIATGLAFKQATQFIDMPAGTYDFSYSLTADGTQLATQNVQLNSGHIYTVYAKGFVAPPVGSNDIFSGDVLRNY